MEHGGKHDVAKHANGSKHKIALEGQKKTQNMASFLIRGASEADQVSKAELKMAMLVAKNNISFAFSDEFNKSVADMFPDSKIAKKYSAGKTKTTQLVKGKSHDFVL